ncbi:MAG: hypothetical protein UU88_C0010G0003 [Parcubacteria group bacterium GW2011_GWC1_42_11]|uniref:Uncharacterized protein n=1 Tax=Candidatus Nomurabacteria bacterium GW2011_GWC2_42_20 TaxID=1618756 RepID=A0A0G0ZHQ9_9BACT|nr:MAG: hypothetical protein UU88_C0010G0003 [Parcubacteria group bacterium GW2011_GWC1_42_11]KKS48267.1 MAG: hypothetical protein UV12_C0002G0116 [Candidatus Nomurabacteria bacterium GW2011_GWC2_42_20]KKT09840.1 MAG: hypothetical protein UV86_C0002G0083 [Candidatus Nomurabacteria bacterium GW2011_GWB1_43_20]
MPEDEVIEDEMVDLGDEVDFDEDMDLGDDDLLLEDDLDLSASSHEIE